MGIQATNPIPSPYKNMNCINLVTIDDFNDFSGGAQVVTESKSQMSQFAYLEQKQASTKHEIYQGDEQTTQAPVFTSSMKSIEVKEGQRAHFECRIIPVSDPTLKVEWLLNGKPLKQGS